MCAAAWLVLGSQEMDKFGVRFKKNFASSYTLGRKLGEVRTA